MEQSFSEEAEMRFVLLGLFLTIMVVSVTSAQSQEKDGKAAAEKTAVTSLDDLKKKLDREGWVTSIVLPEFLPGGLNEKELADGVEVHGYWIANQAIPFKTIKLREGVGEKVIFKGLSIEEETVVALPRRNNDDLKLKLFKTPVCYDRGSGNAIGATIRAPARKEEIKVVLVERAIRIRVRGIERHYFTGSSTIMEFEKKTAMNQKKDNDK